MKLLTVNEAAEATRMSTSWIRMKVFRKELTFLKIGRRVLIPQSTIDDLLAQAVVEPKNKPEAGLDSRGANRDE